MAPPTTEQLNQTRDAVLEQTAESRYAKQGAKKLSGKVCIITGVGPAAGIGTQAARLFAREGAAHLYLLDLSKALPSFAEQLQSDYPFTKINHVIGDAASPKVISELVERVLREVDRLDVYFANAGVSTVSGNRDLSTTNQKNSTRNEMDVKGAIQALKEKARPIEAIDGSEFLEVMRINAYSAFLALKYGGPAIAKTGKGKPIPGGSIILTASVAGRAANAGNIPYSASKAAVVSLAQTGAYEFTGHNVRVNAICPGLIQTDMTGAIFEVAEASGRTSAVGQLNPLKRFGLPIEIAQAALFLASDDSSYINGQPFIVDGGLTGSMPYAGQRTKPWQAKL